MAVLILLRHGQSEWNRENKFTGTEDVDLSMQGELEASRAASRINAYKIDLAYTSVLKRAIHTLNIIMDKNNWVLPVIQDAAFNERDYGDLQGVDKKETVLHYGEDQVERWRRAFDVAPPHGESLKDTFNRVVPFYKTEIEPKLKSGLTILIVAHGNSLRALMMYLENISDDAIEKVEMLTGVPRIYEYALGYKIVSN
ncbi:MAG: 2,3-bisphosphoglycerate-dependent phosphoglycerate mutase [Azospira oryzae]|jgi:2,3-bisphosphoglycerate-dependent phosphoglycerate mutase|nr:2,3-bisphosphoglycerate-dependent phosphoglycerate mutase [Cytophaga sp.]PZR31487.1 MAG: 2,3-bisphosphoglycerate-dependent phosphoglycerate mutase [Azospira oryzae]